MYADRIAAGKEKLTVLTGTLEEQRGTVMGLEGAAGRTYFEALSFIMPDRYRFQGRSRQPAKDEFNCLLNYAYGVLYSMVEKACLIAGLDPYVGFLHTDNYNKKSLVFDLMEMFRYLADQTVVYLFSGRKVKQEWFETVPGGMTLDKDGKAALIQAINETFETSIRYRNRNIKQRDIIQFECHRIANDLIGAREEKGRGARSEGQGKSKMPDYRTNKAWKHAHHFVLQIYECIKVRFPSNEKFGLVSPMRRAAVSIPANIAEGTGS